MASFEAACEVGHAIELDVRFTNDHEIIVFHDATGRRLLGTGRRVDECTYSELSTMRISNTDQTVPRLRDVFSVVRGRVPIYIEVKGTSRRVRGLIRHLYAYNGPFCVISFNVKSVRAVREAATHILTGLTYPALPNPAGNVKHKSLTWLMSLMNAKPSFALGHLRSADSRVLQFMRKRLPLVTWTCRSHDDIDRAKVVADNYMYEAVKPKA